MSKDISHLYIHEFYEFDRKFYGIDLDENTYIVIFDKKKKEIDKRYIKPIKTIKFTEFKKNNKKLADEILSLFSRCIFIPPKCIGIPMVTIRKLINDLLNGDFV